MSPSKPLRVCFAVNHYPPAFGGHGIQLARNLSLLRARGIEPEVLTRRTGHAPATSVEAGTTVHRVFSTGNSPIDKLRRVTEMRTHLRKHGHRYALLHTTVLGWELFANLGLAKRLTLPVVVELIRIGGDDPQTISQQRLGNIKIHQLRKAEHITVIAERFRNHLGPLSTLSESLSVIPTGVDLHRHSGTPSRAEARSLLGLPREGRLVLCVGALVHRKGFDRTLEAWACTPFERGRDCLVIVGPATPEEGLFDAEEETVARLRARARQPDLDGSVRFAGRSDEIEGWMAAADVFLLLSRHEGLGTVLLEAMASSLPCITSSLDGVAAEVVHEGVTGFIVPDADDAQAVAARLTSLLADPSLRERQGRAGRQRAEDRFSLEARVDALAALHRDVARP